MRRFLSVWLPHWATDLWLRQNDAAGPARPLATIATVANHARLQAVNAAAAAAGLQPGMNLANARALVPDLQAVPADPAGDTAALLRLADWCGRFSPWVAADGGDGILLDISGVPHLFGGEAMMLSHMARAFRGLHLGARFGIADTPAAARAWVRHAEGGILPQGSGLTHTGRLPVAALQPDAATAGALLSLGLHTVADLAALPRGPLTQRFGAALLDRLDALLGRREEPISPRAAAAPWRSRVDLAEPVSMREAIERLLEQLLQALCGLLEREQLGARQLCLRCWRVDGGMQALTIGTARPSREPAHLFRLFRDRLETIEPGFGIETFVLEAGAVGRLGPEQIGLEAAGEAGSTDFAQLIDRLQARLGRQAVCRQHPADSHCPERAVITVHPLARWQAQARPPGGARPVLLLRPPEFADMQPDISAFRWRRLHRRIRQATGPERLRGEWWRDGMEVSARDYYRIEDEQGRRYWLFRSPEGWFVHGLFL